VVQGITDPAAWFLYPLLFPRLCRPPLPERLAAIAPVPPHVVPSRKGGLYVAEHLVGSVAGPPEQLPLRLRSAPSLVCRPGQGAPMATTAPPLKNGIHEGAQVLWARADARFGGRNPGSEELPLGIGQIGCIESLQQASQAVKRPRKIPFQITSKSGLRS